MHRYRVTSSAISPFVASAALKASGLPVIREHSRIVLLAPASVTLTPYATGCSP